MESKRGTEAGKWWRFSQYEIRDGAIQPAEGATLGEYDPWAEYEVSRQKGSGSAEPPYQSLARLVQQASFTVDGTLRPESEAAVLDWCSRYGLLGIVPQQYETLPAVVKEEDTDDGPIFMVRHSHYWAADGWDTGLPLDTIGHGAGMPFVVPNRFLHEYFPKGNWKATDYPEIPRPDNPEFWAVYQEPVKEFVRRVVWLNDAIGGLGSVPPSVHHYVSSGLDLPDLDADVAASDFWYGLSLINSLTASVSPIMEVVADGEHAVLRERWVFRSLLASMAMMIHRDLVRGARAYVCKNCGTPFTSSSPKAGYCSLTCRNSAQKRRQRERWQAQGKKVV